MRVIVVERPFVNGCVDGTAVMAIYGPFSTTQEIAACLAVVPHADADHVSVRWVTAPPAAPAAAEKMDLAVTEG